MGKVGDLISELQKKLTELNPTIGEATEYHDKLGVYCKGSESWITNNTWQIGKPYHIHVGFKLDLYLDTEKAQEFINWLKKRRSELNEQRTAKRSLRSLNDDCV